MDVYCGHCAEPWDADEVQHEWLAGDRAKFKAAKGCPGCAWGVAKVLPEAEEQADRARAALELCGDDLDGVASLMDDPC